MHENCGVVAVIDLAGKEDGLAVETAAKMAWELDHRGQLAAGMAWRDAREKTIRLLKDHGRVADVLSLERLRAAEAVGSAAIAHTRYATNAIMDLSMVQPYRYGPEEAAQEFAFAFNGNIANDDERRAALVQSGHPPALEGDTELIGRTMIEAMGGRARLRMRDVFASLSPALDGAFNIVLLQADGSIGAYRDPRGFHPLVYARNERLVAIASEDHAIKQVWGKGVRIQDVQPGYMVRVPPDHGEISYEQVSMSPRSLCFFEVVYFADHRSTIDGVSVANARYECGKILGEMDAGRPDTDIVVPVPDSAKIAANGYADVRGLSRVDAIGKNPGVGRTFIGAGGEDRRQKAARKYRLNGKFLEGESVILLEDSLVRGLTMQTLAGQMRAQGAREIHLRLASPPVLSPCFYGIDFPTVRELIVRHFFHGTLREGGVLPDDVLLALGAELGLDSIKYLPVEAIPRALGKDPEDLCMACVTGRYPTDTGTERAQLQEELHLLQRSQAYAGVNGFVPSGVQRP